MRYEHEYAAANPDWHLEDAPDKVAAVLTSVRRAGLRPRSVCDVGCGAGEVLVQLHRQLGTERAKGYDISSHAIAMANERAGAGVEFAEGDAAADPERFDLMLLLDVIEHVPDPVGFLRTLRPKAPVAIINVPLELSALKVLSAESLARGRRALGHVHYFNEAVAREALAEAGYDVVDAWFDPPGRTPGSRRLLRASQRVLSRVNAPLAARTIGGSSLMMTARPRG